MERYVIVLVDYDNIPELEKNRGPVHAVTRIVDALGAQLQGETELRFRLYSGWFQGNTLSRRAQQILPVLRANFPRVMPIVAVGIPSSVIARAELALALVLSPGKDLTHTYRERSLPKNVRCSAPPYMGCRIPGSCPIGSLYGLVRDSRCPEPGCTVDLATILTKPEQKLVDTMLTVDIVHLAHTTTETIVVASSDDDMWPGIMAALLYGAKVVHIHLLPGRTTPSHYAALAGENYSQGSF
jgi:hypothetical protein